MEKVKLNTIEEAIEDFKAGNFVIVVDDEDRENEGDLIIAAEKITSEKVNFMLKHARGVLCAPITVSRCKELDLPHQVTDNTSVLGTPFTVTVDKLEGCTTGVLQQTVLQPFRHWPIRFPLRLLSVAPDISILCMRRRRGYYVVLVIPRLRFICVVCRVSILPARLWRS